MYKITVLFILYVLVSCNSDKEQTKKQVEQPQPLNAATQKVAQRVVEETKIVVNKTIDGSRFEELVKFANKDETPAKLKEWFAESLDIDTTVFWGYNVYSLSRDRILLKINNGGSCADAECYFDVVVALFDRHKELLDKTNFSFVAPTVGDCDFELVANSIVFGHSETPIFDYDGEFEGAKNTGKLDHQYYYYFVEGENLVDLSKADKSKVRLARNTIYAQKGYKFNSKDLQDHFSKKDWYTPKYDKTDGLLTDIEESIAQGLLELEKKK